MNLQQKFKFISIIVFTFDNIHTSMQHLPKQKQHGLLLHISCFQLVSIVLLNDYTAK